MRGLLTSEISRMRAAVEESLPETCTLRRKVYASDGAGGQTDTTSTIGTYACRIGMLGNDPQQRVIAAQLNTLVVYVLTLPAETPVLAGDELVVGSRVFAVEGVIEQSYEVSRRCVCAEVG